MINKKLIFISLCAIFSAACSSNPPVVHPEPEVQEAVDNHELDIPELVKMMVQVSNAANSQDADGLSRLQQFAHHPDYLIRVEAMNALGNDYFRKTSGGYEALTKAVNDDHWLVRSIAIKALAKEYHNGTLEVLRTRQQIESHERVLRYLATAINNLEQLQKASK